MSALTDTFTAIANAIRAKLGVSTTYTPAQMASAIASIPKAVLQTKTQTVTPSANWSGTNTNNATISPDSGYDGMSQVNVNVPMLRDNTLMTADTVDTPGTVYNGNTSQSNSQKLLRMHPTKDGMSYTGSYLYMKPNSYLGNAVAADVASGKTFSSSNGIQITGTGSGGGTITKTTLWTWNDTSYNSGKCSFQSHVFQNYDYFIMTFAFSASDPTEYKVAMYAMPSSVDLSFGMVITAINGDYSESYVRSCCPYIYQDYDAISIGGCLRRNTSGMSTSHLLPRKFEGVKLNNITIN